MTKLKICLCCIKHDHIAARVTALFPHIWKQSQSMEEAQKALIFYRLQRKKDYKAPAANQIKYARRGANKDNVKVVHAHSDEHEKQLYKRISSGQFFLLECNWVILWTNILKAEGVKDVY